jgi:hypothetical protein
MIDVSSKFVSIMNSNIRPKTDFKITVTGNDNTLEWTSKDITNFEFKRGIDPVGRNLPFLELTWEEIYLGELNTDNEATKYNNIVPYMTVELTIEQSLSFANTWKDIYSYTWSDLFNNGLTWRDVLKKPISESVKMPTMYLVGKPEVQNQKIKWTARDFIYFLNTPQEIGFIENISFTNPLRYFLLDERANFKNNNDIIEALTRTGEDIKDYFLIKNEVLSIKTLFNSTTKNILKNYLNVVSCFLNFGDNYAYINQMFGFTSSANPFEFKGKIMRLFPKMTKGKNISAFSFTQYNVKLDEDNKYTLLASDETFENLNYNKIYRYFYKDFGMIEINDSNSSDFPPKTINKNILTTLNPISVIPVSLNSAEIFINNEKNGEQYTENNPCNFWGLEHTYTNFRKTELDKWFNEGKYTMEFDGLPVFHLEPFDYVAVETNLFENGVRVVKKGVILEQYLTFNGGFNQKTIVREV